jgi:hypothetical protein
MRSRTRCCRQLSEPVRLVAQIRTDETISRLVSEVRSGRSFALVSLRKWLPSVETLLRKYNRRIVLSLSCVNYSAIPYCIHLPQNLGDRAGRGYEGLLFQPFVFALISLIGQLTDRTPSIQQVTKE